MITLAIKIRDAGSGKVDIKWAGVGGDDRVTEAETDAYLGLAQILEQGIKKRTGRNNEVK